MKSRRFAQSWCHRRGREESTTKLGKAFELRRQTVGRIRLSVSRRVIVVGSRCGRDESKTPNEEQIGPVMKTAHKPQRLPNRGQACSTPIAPKKPPMTANKMTASANPTVDTRRSGSTRSQWRKTKRGRPRLKRWASARSDGRGSTSVRRRHRLRDWQMSGKGFARATTVRLRFRYAQATPDTLHPRSCWLRHAEPEG